MNISYLLAQVFNGIQFGVVMAVLAIGLSLIFGMLSIINFAHGSFYMLGAYLLWTCLQLLKIPGNFWLGLVITILLMAVLGAVLERFLLHRMYDQPVIYQVLVTFGLLLVIQQGVALVYGTIPLPLKVPTYLDGEVNLGLFTYPLYNLFIMILGLAVVFCVWFFVERSMLGSVIRASAESVETVKILGIDPRKVYNYTFALGSSLAGLGGALHAPVLGSLQHSIGAEVLLICFIVVVIGGMGSIWGTLVAGISLGVVRGIAGIFWAPASDFAMFVAMGVILLIRPRGLFGRGGSI